MEEIIYENAKEIELKPIEVYIESALVERYELNELNLTMDNLLYLKTIYEENKTYKYYTDIQLEYNMLVNDIESLELEILAQRNLIAREVENIYLSLQQQLMTYQIYESRLTKLQSDFDLIQAQYESGLILETTYLKEKYEIDMEIIKLNLERVKIYRQFQELKYIAGLGA